MVDSPETQTTPSSSSETSEYFLKNKYVILDRAVDPEICAFLTNHMHKLVLNRKTVSDVQCPLSQSIYGDALFDGLLEDLRPLVEEATGLKLNPTYSYARRYAPGDELKPHLDREACEISVTVTLGFQGNVWPIHISRDETVENDIGAIDLSVGSMAIYRGLEINHWREPYKEGEWQCQVFLHYVDANGPHKDLKFDERHALGTDSVREKKPADHIFWEFGVRPENKYLYITKTEFLNDDMIRDIIDYGQGKLFDARVGVDEQDTLDKTIRNVSHCWLPFSQFSWLYENLENEIKNVNWFNFKFLLNHMENIDYLEYHAGAEEEDNEHKHGKYVQHIDGGVNSNRKLSFSVLLSDPSEFEGGDLLLYVGSKPYVIEKKKGMITFFPSNVLHEVTPVTKGVRRSIVSWVHGPYFA